MRSTIMDSTKALEHVLSSSSINGLKKTFYVRNCPEEEHLFLKVVCKVSNSNAKRKKSF